MLQDHTTKIAAFADRKMSRRSFNGWVLASSAALATVSAIQACSPLRYLAHAYPAKFTNDKALRDRLLHAFVETVVPGGDTDSDDAIRIFYDEYYPFHTYTAFFLNDLTSRSKSLMGTDDFASLGQRQREQVIASGLHADATLAKLYRGAIFGTKAAIYGGIYDDALGCPHIDFHGENNGFGDKNLFYADAPQYLAHEITPDGNPQ